MLHKYLFIFDHSSHVLPYSCDIEYWVLAAGEVGLKIESGEMGGERGFEELEAVNGLKEMKEEEEKRDKRSWKR